MKLLSGTIRPRLPSCQTCRNASNTTTLVGGKWWEKVPVKQPSCWNSFEKFWSNRHTESSHQFSTWFILIRSAIYDFCQIMTFLTHTKWITSDYLLFILDIATAWRTSDRHFHNSFFFFSMYLRTHHLGFTVLLQRAFSISVSKRKFWWGRGCLCHIAVISWKGICVCGSEMAENQQGGGAPDEGQTPAKGKKSHTDRLCWKYRQTKACSVEKLEENWAMILVGKITETTKSMCHWLNALTQLTHGDLVWFSLWITLHCFFFFF